MTGYSLMRGEQRRHLLMELYDVLEECFGPMNWWPADTAFEVCIGAILTQNAPWSGVKRAIVNLKDAGLFGIHEIDSNSETVIADAVRPSIYYNQKAKRLKSFCRFLLKHYDGEIENMSAVELHEARSMLLSLPGIGYETADSILLYALNKPVFVVDAYTRRIFSRHGLIDPSWSYEHLRMYFEEVLDPDVHFYNEFHALLCHLGAEKCKRKPRCDECPGRRVMGEMV